MVPGFDGKGFESSCEVVCVDEVLGVSVSLFPVVAVEAV